MEIEKPRLSRLTAIITELQAKRLVTAQSLADKYGVSVRTIYRDIRTLENSGIPIVTEEGKGYSIVEGYHLPPVTFTEQEANALITAEQIINRNKDISLIRNYASAITKLKSVLNLSSKEKLQLLEDRIQIRSNVANEKSSNLLIDLQSAIVNYSVARIRYRNVKGYEGERAVEPFALFNTHENWVLVAYCRKCNDFRAFRLDRIEELQVTLEAFEPHDITLHEYFERCKAQWNPTPDIGLSQVKPKFATEQKNKDVKAKQKEGFQVVGLSFRMKNDEDAMSTFSSAWRQFVQSGLDKSIENIVGSEIYAVYTNYKSDHLGPYDFIIGYQVSEVGDIGENLATHEVPSGSYQKFTCEGDITKGAMYHTWNSIWKSDISRVFATDYEVYDHRATDPTNAVVDIFVSVNAEN